MLSHIALASAAAVALSLPLVANAQTTATAPPAGTLTIERVDQGLVVATDVRVTDVNGDTATLAGGYFGWMTDRTWLVGAGGYWLANQDDLKMAYGGMVVEWLGRSSERIGFGLKGLVGGGRATLGSTVGESFGADIQPLHAVNWNRHRGPIGGGRSGGIIDADTEILVREYFFVAEPQAGVVLHFASWARLELGVGYRFAAGAGRLDDELSGASASIAIQFGGTSRQKP
jgi:hypothetical protein